MLAPLGKSDHAVILLELLIQLFEDKQLPSFSLFYQKTRRSELVEAATMVNWQQISSLESVTDIDPLLRECFSSGAHSIHTHYYIAAEVRGFTHVPYYTFQP